MPTGGGKSITFQVPAMAMEGVCIVITPLIALMKDQVQHLLRIGIRAGAIYSGMPRKDIVQMLENCIFGGIKILYISPERLASELFQTKLGHMKVSFITVDEAHCISQWGYDFRPSYLEIKTIRHLLPGIPVLALTATATPEVVDDIQDKLGFERENVFRMSFERKNLAYVVRKAEDKTGELIHILQRVKGSAIVYVRSRKRARQTAEELCHAGINATYFHAGLDHTTKDTRQKAWQEGQNRVIVATNAFGMGIDKPDVRLVIHIDCPDSLEAYFQEAGRAGRDGKKAYAVLLYNNHDHVNLEKRIEDTFPPKEFVRKVYEYLAYFFEIGVGSGGGKTLEFPIDKFCYVYKFFPIPVNSALQLLERCGYLHYESDPDNSARLKFKIGRDDLYKLDEFSEKTEAVITALLRTYGGLFSDYVYIDESLIALQADLNKSQVYMILKMLSMRQIVDFIPQRKMPYITLLQDREDGDKIIIPPKVYEERKEQYTKRIRAMRSYLNNDSICRSRQLLLYFGEESKHDCQQCDVCLNHRHDYRHEDQVDHAKKQILQLLADGERHHITELHDLLLPRAITQEAVSYLVAEELIQINESFLSR